MITPVEKRDIIVIGASAGGVPILQFLCQALPADLPATLGIVLHRGPWFGGDVSQIYGRPHRIIVREARQGDRLERGMVYFAPADQHMEFQETHIQLSRGAKVHFTRPAIDRLVVSAARALGRRVAGVLLTGGNADGAHGLVCIKKSGGATFVQRPQEAAHPEMPLSGLKEDAPMTVAARDLPALLIALATGHSLNFLENEIFPERVQRKSTRSP